MEWDLGFGGFLYLLVMAFAAALAAQAFTWRLARWLWAAATAAYTAIGLLVSEVWFGWATEEELQPNIDGLSRDEVLLAMVLCVVGTVALVRSWAKHHPGVGAGPRPS